MNDDFRPYEPPKPANQNPQPTPAQQPPTPPHPPSTVITPDNFKTPDQIAQQDALRPEPPAMPGAAEEQPPKKRFSLRGNGKHWFNVPWPPTKLEIIIAAAIVVLAIGGTSAYVIFKPEAPKPEPAAVTKPAKVEPPKPTTVESLLSGLQVDPSLNERPVVSVMIENSRSARPQSGLSDAGVVFEAIAEGGITRFLALFQDKQPSNIGPVRSARPYYVQWSEGFRSAYAHVGGSPVALENIKDWGVQDLNQFAYPGPYRRISERSAPHNMYSNVVDLAALAEQKGFKSEYTGFARKPAKAVLEPTAKSIDLNISSSLYNVHYDFDSKTNTYKRSEGGEAHIDANTKKQLAPNVVVGMVVPFSYTGRTSQGGSYSKYGVIGSGVAYVFQDGEVTVGSWSKESNTDQITFTDESGATLNINPGQTWITAVSDSGKVVYK